MKCKKKCTLKETKKPGNPKTAVQEQTSATDRAWLWYQKIVVNVWLTVYGSQPFIAHRTL